MSLKPLKKTDLNKDWMKRRRDIPKKIQPEYQLIVSEGTDTEPNYFGAIRDTINSRYPGRIQLDIFGEGDNTISLFEKAKTRAENNLNGYKHVWVVYDTDDFPAEHIDETANFCKKCSSNKMQYHAIWSNQCIELWFLLHFSYLQSDLHRKEYWPKLSECLNRISAGDYTKNRIDMFSVLKPYMNTALSNAKKLNEWNKDKKPSQSTPGTKIYELVVKLQPYL